MRSLVAFLADSAIAHPDGKFYVLGGGFDTVVAAQFPSVVSQFSVVNKVEFSEEDLEHPHLLQINVTDEQGIALEPIMKSPFVPARPPSTVGTKPVNGQFVVNLMGV